MKRLSVEEIELFIQVPHRLIHAILRGRLPPAVGRLNRTLGRTLAVVRKHGPVSMHQLGNLVGMPKGSFTQVIDKLVRRGLARRSKDAEDRRVVMVSITEKGLQIVQKFDDHFRKHLSEALAVLQDDEIKAVVNALRTIEHTT